jgi:hypothetical protein
MKFNSPFSRVSSLILVTSALILGLFINSSEQETVVITLHVDTGAIDNKNLATTCTFGQADDISNEDYTVVVNVGDNIVWEGVSSTSESDVVDITKIKYVRGKNIFAKDLDPDGTGPRQKVRAKVLSRTDGGEYKYDISFTVTSNGKKRNGTFHIDPKIQTH